MTPLSHDDLIKKLTPTQAQIDIIVNNVNDEMESQLRTKEYYNIKTLNYSLQFEETLFGPDNISRNCVLNLFGKHWEIVEDDGLVTFNPHTKNESKEN